jgi:phosphoribosylformylglycinamidine synthase II
VSEREQTWRIEVWARRAADDARGRDMGAVAGDLGFDEVTSIRATRVYQLRGQLEQAAVERLAAELFATAVLEDWRCAVSAEWPAAADGSADATHYVEVQLQPGVMDPVAASAQAAANALLGADHAGTAEPVTGVRTGWRYAVTGLADATRLAEFARQVLANPCIEWIHLCGGSRRDALPQGFPKPPDVRFERREIPLSGQDDTGLAETSRAGRLFLNVEEMRAIREHFATLGREPTDLELETIAQTWSEHCVHKTLKSAVTYRGAGFADPNATVEVHYDNLLRDTIARATRELDRDWCLSVFVDNAGVIAFDAEHGIAFKAETHNHPSAIEPYGGAATGIGGCIRDILGCGLGAKPIANTDVFCVAYPDFPNERIPPGVLRPRRVLRGIVAGVRDYGNRMGIPTVAGALHFDDRYLANPLVFCGCVGLIPRNRIAKAPQAGDRVVVAGGRTGRDGIGGATFSSGALTEAHADEFAHAVQIGNAIEEKKVTDALLRARDHASGCLYHAVTDCGAGGLSSAVGEMAETLGAVVDLENVPLKYSGLRYNEIWLSEAQERMVFAVPPDRVDALLGVFAEEEVEATVIGTFTGDGVLRLRYRGTEVGSLDVGFLHEGVPMPRRAAAWTAPKPNPLPERTPALAAGESATDRLLRRLAHPNVCSREAIFRQYDQEVQGGSVIKPLVGRGEGPSDAAVVQPILGQPRGIALGMGLCPQVADRDPYAMAARAIDEAIRNVICVGADPERIALLDNFCWGGCRDEAEMGALVRACQACYDAALAHGTPFISGKDSLNNQFNLAAQEAAALGLPECIAIPHTLLISALGIIDDIATCVTSDFKQPGARVVLVLSRPPATGLGFAESRALHRAVAGTLRQGQAGACHDVGDDGLAVCLAEMAIGGGLGIEVASADVEALQDDAWFTDALAGYVLEVGDDFDANTLAEAGRVIPLGHVGATPRLRIGAIDVAVEQAAAAWRTFTGFSESE